MLDRGAELCSCRRHRRCGTGRWREVIACASPSTTPPWSMPIRSAPSRMWGCGAVAGRLGATRLIDNELLAAKVVDVMLTDALPSADLDRLGKRFASISGYGLALARFRLPGRSQRRGWPHGMDGGGPHRTRLAAGTRCPGRRVRPAGARPRVGVRLPRYGAMLSACCAAGTRLSISRGLLDGF